MNEEALKEVVVSTEPKSVEWLKGTINRDDPNWCDLCNSEHQHSATLWKTDKGRVFRACRKHLGFCGRFYSFYLPDDGIQERLNTTEYILGI